MVAMAARPTESRRRRGGGLRHRRGGGDGDALRRPVAGSDGEEGPDGSGGATAPAGAPDPASRSVLPSRSPQPGPRLNGDGRAGQGLADREAGRRGPGPGPASLSGSGPGGRIVKADVERAASGEAEPAGRRAGAGGSRPGGAGRADRGGAGEAGDREGAGGGRRADQAAADGRAADGRVEGDGAALLPAGGDRHDARRWRAESGSRHRRRRARSCRPFNDMVVKACALALREFPRANGAYRDGKLELYSRVNVGVAVAAAGRAGRADGLRRRPQGPAADRDRDEGPRRAGARRLDHPAGALGGDLHGLQPGHVRDLELPRRDQHLPGGHPRRRRAEGEAGRPRRRARRPRS